MSRWILLSVAVSLVLGSARPARGEVKVGDVRTVAPKDGAIIRDAARPLGKLLGRAEYGTRLRVDAIEGLWAQVSRGSAPEGWVRTGDLVEPSALTGAGAFGPAKDASFSSSEVAAAGRQFTHDDGRQFDSKTERTWRSMSDGKLDAGFAAIDRLQKATPSEEEIDAFIRAGYLGGLTPDAGPSLPALTGPTAKLKLIGAVGEGTSTGSGGIDPALLNAPTPMTDADFVRRLGLGFSPEQEYFLGRSVAAAAIAEHGLDPDEALQAWVRRIGATVARLSDRLRGTHGGWHFAVLAGEVPNAISGPGGFVLISRGAIRLARNEDEVAGILSHEMAHVAYKHGERMIRKTREFQASLKKLQDDAIRPVPGPDGCNICADVARLLGQASSDFVKTLDKEGYGKEFELEADWDGSLYLCESGYRASAIAEYLELLPDRGEARWTTHPSSDDRIEALRPLVYKHGCPFEADEGAKARLPRFVARAKKK